MYLNYSPEFCFDNFKIMFDSLLALLYFTFT